LFLNCSRKAGVSQSIPVAKAGMNGWLSKRKRSLRKSTSPRLLFRVKPSITPDNKGSKEPLVTLESRRVMEFPMYPPMARMETVPQATHTVRSDFPALMGARGPQVASAEKAEREAAQLPSWQESRTRPGLITTTLTAVREEKAERVELVGLAVPGAAEDPEVTEQTVNAAKEVPVMAEEAVPVDEEAKEAPAAKVEKEVPADGVKIFRSLTRRALPALITNYSEEAEAIRAIRDREACLERTDPAESQGKKLRQIIVHHRVRQTARRRLTRAILATANSV
jgi:hypothetical protein